MQPRERTISFEPGALEPNTTGHSRVGRQSRLLTVNEPSSPLEERRRAGTRPSRGSLVTWPDVPSVWRPSRVSFRRNMPTSYPMYVMHVKDVLGLTTLEPHQKLLRMGKLIVYDDAMCEEGHDILFISHQWTSFDEPDHTGRSASTPLRTPHTGIAALSPPHMPAQLPITLFNWRKAEWSIEHAIKLITCMSGHTTVRRRLAVSCRAPAAHSPGASVGYCFREGQSNKPLLWRHGHSRRQQISQAEVARVERAHRLHICLAGEPGPWVPTNEDSTRIPYPGSRGSEPRWPRSLLHTWIYWWLGRNHTTARVCLPRELHRHPPCCLQPAHAGTAHS